MSACDGQNVSFWAWFLALTREDFAAMTDAELEALTERFAEEYRVLRAPTRH